MSLSLLTAKARVAPVKPQTMPKLELSGAREGTRLLQTTAKYLDLDKFYRWIDSLVVLGWIRGHKNKWKQYVSIRVHDIVSVLPHLQWRYVPSKENPADFISRGLMPQEIPHLSTMVGRTSMATSFTDPLASYCSSNLSSRST